MISARANLSRQCRALFENQLLGVVPLADVVELQVDTATTEELGRKPRRGEKIPQVKLMFRGFRLVADSPEMVPPLGRIVLSRDDDDGAVLVSGVLDSAVWDQIGAMVALELSGAENG